MLQCQTVAVLEWWRWTRSLLPAVAKIKAVLTATELWFSYPDTRMLNPFSTEGPAPNLWPSPVDTRGRQLPDCHLGKAPAADVSGLHRNLQPSCWCKHSYQHFHECSTPTVGIMSPSAASFRFQQVGTLCIGANGCGLFCLWAPRLTWQRHPTRRSLTTFGDGCRACLTNGASFGSPWTNKD